MSVFIAPPFSLIIQNVKTLFSERKFNSVAIDPVKYNKKHDAIVITSFKNRDTDFLFLYDKNIPIVVILDVFIDEHTKQCIEQLLGKKFLYLVGCSNSLSNDYVWNSFLPYQYFIHDSLLVATHAAYFSLSNEQPTDIFLDMIKTQYHGLTGDFSFHFNGKRTNFNTTLFKLESNKTLTDIGYISEKGLTVYKENLIPIKKSSKQYLFGFSGVLVGFLVIFLIGICYLAYKKRISGTIHMKDVALSFPPLSATSHAKTYYGMLGRKKVCVKLLNQKHKTKEIRHSYRKLRKIKNERIVTVIGGSTNPEMLVMEFVYRESLALVISAQDPFVRIQEIQFKITKEILEGIEFLHKCKYLHLNLTPNNVLITDKYDVKLTDFDKSVFCHNKEEDVFSWKKMKIRYSPPELLLNEQSNEKSDIHMWGMLIWYIDTSSHPLPEIVEKERIVQMITKGERPNVNKMKNQLFKECCQLCWEHQITKRASIQELRQLKQFRCFT
ncbi:serine-threonine protein kinase [Entamoeba marina]